MKYMNLKSACAAHLRMQSNGKCILDRCLTHASPRECFGFARMVLNNGKWLVIQSGKKLAY